MGRRIVHGRMRNELLKLFWLALILFVLILQVRRRYVREGGAVVVSIFVKKKRIAHKFHNFLQVSLESKLTHSLPIRSNVE